MCSCFKTWLTSKAVRTTWGLSLSRKMTSPGRQPWSYVRKPKCHVLETNRRCVQACAIYIHTSIPYPFEEREREVFPHLVAMWSRHGALFYGFLLVLQAVTAWMTRSEARPFLLHYTFDCPYPGALFCETIAKWCLKSTIVETCPVTSLRMTFYQWVWSIAMSTCNQVNSANGSTLSQASKIQETVNCSIYTLFI